VFAQRRDGSQYSQKRITFYSLTCFQDKTNVRPGVVMDDAALLQYTGGTTGIAKGDMLTEVRP
jgi:acyl-CoA synthetase (AMP-forming)/AMP-acid ligase II